MSYRTDHGEPSSTAANRDPALRSRRVDTHVVDEQRLRERRLRAHRAAQVPADREVDQQVEAVVEDPGPGKVAPVAT
jgi:hypothetical protein